MYLRLSKTSKVVICWALFWVWLIISAYVLWFKLSDSYRFFMDDKQPDFSAFMFREPQTRYTIIHFIDPNCSCSQYSHAHINAIKNELGALQHVHVQPGEEAVFFEGEPQAWLISSPSAALISPSGELIYYGPYTDALLCNEGQDLIKQALRQTQKNDDFRWYNVLGYGCFCDWPAQAI